ncbi:hypothetical protein KL86PLE_41458 [uncultured Pleomorphomonas sp.]|uniref:Uncharacterized protein n=1 Tax=uncultured Pleomorphomonas sp. TaxID=442121 RepID=A0A212LJE7_9HYPH|nr:hypothetical protein KL86PLE_41458 [uncultured Pleomorphomonas sp.]
MPIGSSYNKVDHYFLFSNCVSKHHHYTFCTTTIQ